jgi:hypothetical protein
MTRPWILLVPLALGLVAGSAAADGLTLSPAVVPLGGRPGQSTQQHLTLFNDTAQELTFRLVAKDVITRKGVRVFVDAGERPGSIAATAVFSSAQVTIRPREERSVDVTLTLPARVTDRAVVILFVGTTQISRGATVSIGSLLTFDLSGRLSLAVSELHATPPTPSANGTFRVPVSNDGTEPAIVRGVAAIIDAKGAMIGKTTLEQRRLLPGEEAALQAEYPGTLPPGTYRVVATIEAFKKSWTRFTALEVR